MGTYDEKNEKQAGARNPWLSPHFFLCRWRLALLTVPVIGAMIGFRCAVWYGAGVGGWIDQSVFTSFIVLAVFVSAVLLQGVVQDFKESEKMPSVLQSAFWSLTGELEKAKDILKESDKEQFMKESIKCVRNMFYCILKTLDSKDNAWASFEENSKLMREAEAKLFSCFIKFKAKPKKIGKPIETIRKTFGRMYVIQATSYIPACYCMMDSMVIIVFTLMTTTNWPTDTAFAPGMSFTVIITFLFTFLWLMVRSLEDPFEYPHDYNMNCYTKGSKIPMSLREEFWAVGSIDMSGLTVEFGQHLCKLCKDHVIDADRQSMEVELKRDAAPKQKESNAGRAQSSSSGQAVVIFRSWRIFLRTLPGVAAMIGLRLAVWYGGNVGGWIDPKAFTSFISLTVFVTALLLQGLIQDYKESEKMPSDLMNAFQGLVAAVCTLKENRLKCLFCVKKLLCSVISILDCEGEEVADSEFHEATKVIREAETELFVCFINNRAFDVITSIIKPLVTIRNLTSRINVIRRTSYILSGYSLVDSMILIVFVLMTVSNWPLETAWTTAVSYTVIITFLFSYLAILIRKVEDPIGRPKLNDGSGYHRKCFEFSTQADSDLKAEQLRAMNQGTGAVEMHPVTMIFGKQLQILIEEAKAEANAQESQTAAGSPQDAHCVGGQQERAREKENQNQKSSQDTQPFSTLSLVRRWRLAIAALPAVCLLVAARIAVWYGAGVGGWADPSPFTTFISVVIFVAVILIQGVVSDYKEAEKMPSELFGALEALTTAIEVSDLPHEPCLRS